MIQWLYRNMFRGIGIAFLIGAVTLVYLWVGHFRQLANYKTPAPIEHQTSGGKR